MSTLPKVAVLGLGAMGHAFASNLLKNGFTVAGWNRSPARGEDLQAHGLSLHATPQQAVADAEVIISMLADGEATLEVLAQIAPACQPQAIYCQMGTIGLPETRQAIAMLRELQPAMTYIDAPVSGTKAPAEKAQIRCSPAEIGKRAPLPNRCLRLSPAGRSGLARRATARK